MDGGRAFFQLEKLKIIKPPPYPLLRPILVFLAVYFVRVSNDKVTEEIDGSPLFP